MWCLPPLSFTLHTSASLPFKDKYLNCHLCDIQHLTGSYTHSPLSLSAHLACVCQVHVLHPPLGDKALQQFLWMYVCVFYLTTAPIPADSAGIRSDFLCQQQPPSFIPPVFSFLLLSSGCPGWVWGETLSSTNFSVRVLLAISIFDLICQFH